MSEESGFERRGGGRCLLMMAHRMASMCLLEMTHCRVPSFHCEYSDGAERESGRWWKQSRQHSDAHVTMSRRFGGEAAKGQSEAQWTLSLTDLPFYHQVTAQFTPARSEEQGSIVLIINLLRQGLSGFAWTGRDASHLRLHIRVGFSIRSQRAGSNIFSLSLSRQVSRRPAVRAERW